MSQWWDLATLKQLPASHSVPTERIPWTQSSVFWMGALLWLLSHGEESGETGADKKSQEKECASFASSVHLRSPSILPPSSQDPGSWPVQTHKDFSDGPHWDASVHCNCEHRVLPQVSEFVSTLCCIHDHTKTGLSPIYVKLLMIFLYHLCLTLF